MFVGALLGFILGALLTGLVLLPFANSSKFIESVGVGFGIGLAFIGLGVVLNIIVKFADRQSQKIKRSPAE